MRQLEHLKIGGTAGGTAHRDTSVPDITSKVRMVNDAGVFDYIDRCPPDDEFRALVTASERYDMPVLSSGWFYTLDRDALLFERNIHKARLLGSQVHNVQVLTQHADGHAATNREVADFYAWACETGRRQNVVPCFEVHVNIWSEHFGRVEQVAELVRQRGLPFHMTLDHSHVIFKMDNPKEQPVQGMKTDIDAGNLILDPAQPGNVARRWIDANWVCWPMRDLLAHHATHDASPIRHISCEHIVGLDYGAGHKYSTFDNNVACARWLREEWVQALAATAA